MASFSLLSGLGVIEVYGVANWVLFAPLLFFSIAAFCAMLDSTAKERLPIIWALSAAIMVVMTFLFGRWFVKTLFFASESYLLSLGILLLALALLFKRKLVWPDLLLMGFLSAMIASSKGPVGVMYCGLWLVRFLVIRSDFVKRDLVALIVVLATVSWTVQDTALAASGGISWSPFQLIRSHSFLHHHLDAAMVGLFSGEKVSAMTWALAILALVSFFIIHFSLSWIVIAEAGYRSGSLRGFLGAPMGVYSLAAVLGGSAIVAATDAWEASNVFYFTNFAFFVSLPSVAVMLSAWLSRREVNDHRSIAVLTLLIFFLSLKGLYKHSGLDIGHSKIDSNVLISDLIALRQTASLDIVYRPGPTDFSHNPVKSCLVRPLVFPAISERAWIGVLDHNNHCNLRGWGYGNNATVHQGITGEPRLLPGMRVQGR